LFGGQTVADDLARRGSDDADELTGDDAEVAEALEDERPGDHAGEFDDAEELSKGQMVLRGCWIVVQSIIAVVFGAGLFIAFDQLWKWNNIVALVLSVLVILGLVVGVRVVRKTEDIASTLIAVAVGALVTLGPLALLQSN
jgi:F0F1-type ATP synthase assembly protein I